MRPFSLSIVLTLLGPPAVAQAPPDPVSRVPAILREELATQPVASLSVVILHGDRMLYADAVGHSDIEANRAATPDTVYQLGSISKQFTAAAILTLVEAGRLGLEDRLVDRLPEVPAAWGGVRLHHLLQHTSGIREFLFLPEFEAAASDPGRPSEDLLKLILQQPLDFTPGERWSYSNSNYTLLAAVVERVTGNTYEEFITSQFARPLGLGSLHHCSPQPRGEGDARGYQLRGRQLVPAPAENMNWARGDGGLCGTAHDVARWTRALHESKVIAPQSLQRMTVPAVTRQGSAPYGFGLSLLPLDFEHSKVAHHGAMAGFSGMAAYYSGSHLTVVVLTNRGGVWADAIEKRIARAVQGLPSPPPAARSVSAAVRAKAASRYEFTAFPMQLVERDGELHMESPPPGPSGSLGIARDGSLVLLSAPDGVRIESGRGDFWDEVVLEMAGMRWFGRRITRN